METGDTQIFTGGGTEAAKNWCGSATLLYTNIYNITVIWYGLRVLLGEGVWRELSEELLHRVREGCREGTPANMPETIGERLLWCSGNSPAVKIPLQ
jgi:hypothetical protein